MILRKKAFCQYFFFCVFRSIIFFLEIITVSFPSWLWGEPSSRTFNFYFLILKSFICSWMFKNLSRIEGVNHSVAPSSSFVFFSVSFFRSFCFWLTLYLFHSLSPPLLPHHYQSLFHYLYLCLSHCLCLCLSQPLFLSLRQIGWYQNPNFGRNWYQTEIFRSPIIISSLCLCLAFLSLLSLLLTSTLTFIHVWNKFDLLSTPQSRLRNLRVT